MTSNTIAIKPNMDPRAIETLQVSSASRLDFTETPSLEASDLTTTTAAHMASVERIAKIIASYRISGPGDKYGDVMEFKIVDTLRSFIAH